MITTVLWDIDYTLLDFVAAENYAMKRCFEILGIGTCTDEMVARYSCINHKYWEMLERGEITKQQTLEGRFHDFFEKEGLPADKAAAFNEEYQIRLGDHAVFLPHGRETIETLQHMGIRQYAVTNGTLTCQQRKIAKLHLDEIFIKAFISDEIGYEKPSVGFFDAVWQELGDVPADELLLVGDSLTSDMRGANNAHIPACWYNPHGAVNDKGVQIDYEIRDLAEVIELVKKSTL